MSRIRQGAGMVIKTVVGLVIGLAVTSLDGAQQPKKVPRIGFMSAMEFRS